MHIIADIIVVVMELQSRPLEVDARLELIGWNSSIKSAVAPGTLIKPFRRAII
jgi:hypothetical protein